MSQQHGSQHPTDDLSGSGKQALAVLRGVWQANDQTSTDIDESCGNTKSCKNMANVGFQGMADETDENKDAQSVGSGMRSAWKKQLEREGKLGSSVTSVRDLVFGSEPKR